LNPARIVCGECGWLRPLAPGYAIDCSAFQWSEDGKAMSALRALRPLNAAARAVSDKIGRRWVETTFNAVLLGENQLPDVYAQAVRAARLLGMSHMPDVYVSGERMWDCLTFGSDRDSFILLGTAIVTNFQGDDLLFLLAREIGHCRAGHALWKTVTRFLLGDHGPRKGLLSNGVFAALSPSALLEGALEMPLLAWARQAEITADRAGLLAVGDEGIARRVLLSWTLKSAFLYRRINIDAWLEQQAADEDSTMTRLSELTTSSTPYITRRLNLLTQFARSPELAHWRSVIGRFAPPLLPAAPPQPNGGPALAATQSTQPPTQTQATQASPTGARPAAGQSGPRPTPQDDDIRLKCASCGTPMRVPKKVLAGKQQLNVRCPNSGCTKLVTLRRKAAPAAAPNTAQQPAALNNTERNQSNGDE
jgi:Zn-dependent protease with chaperone function